MGRGRREYKVNRIVSRYEYHHFFMVMVYSPVCYSRPAVSEPRYYYKICSLRNGRTGRRIEQRGRWREKRKKDR